MQLYMTKGGDLNYRASVEAPNGSTGKGGRYYVALEAIDVCCIKARCGGVCARSGLSGNELSAI